MILTIQRSKWLRGNDGDGSCLLDNDGKMCCLGFYAKALGAEDSQIFAVTIPQDCDSPEREKIFSERSGGRWILSEDGAGDSHDAVELIVQNDSNYLTEEEREWSIQELFARHGVEVVFVD